MKTKPKTSKHFPSPKGEKNTTIQTGWVVWAVFAKSSKREKLREAPLCCFRATQRRGRVLYKALAPAKRGDAMGLGSRSLEFFDRALIRTTRWSKKSNKMVGQPGKKGQSFFSLVFYDKNTIQIKRETRITCFLVILFAFVLWIVWKNGNEQHVCYFSAISLMLFFCTLRSLWGGVHFCVCVLYIKRPHTIKQTLSQSISGFFVREPL